MADQQGIYTVSGNLREEAAIKAELEKSNFDLKMRVFYLEEKLTRLAGGESTAALFAPSDDSTTNALRLQVEEKNLELEQRNLLLTKAKVAIEALKKEVERSKAEHGKTADLEDRVRRLKSASDEMDAQYKAQIAQIEGQLATARQATAQLAQAKAASDGQTAALELQIRQAGERHADLCLQRDRADEASLHARQASEGLEEELLQLRAHVDLYRLRGEEHGAEFETLRVAAAEAAMRAKSQEQECKHRIDEAHSRNQIEMAALRQQHHLDLENALREVREEARSDADHAKSQAEGLLREARAHEQKEVSHERAQLNLRIDDLIKRSDEKQAEMRCLNDQRQAEVRALNDEMRALRAQHEADRTKAEHAIRDSEVARVELRLNAETIEGLKKSLEESTEELRHLRKNHEHGAEVKEGLRREQIDKGHLAQRLEQSEEQVEKLRQTLHDKEIRLLHDESEMRRLHSIVEDLKARCSNQEEIVRENERVKADNHTLKVTLTIYTAPQS